MSTTNYIANADNEPKLKRVLTALMMYEAGLVDLPTIAMGLGTSEADVLALLDDPQIVGEHKAAVLRQIQTGELQQLQAKGLLNSVIEKLSDHIDDPELPLAAMLKTGEFLLKVSGVEAERAAKLRNTEDTTPKFSVQFVYKDDPPPAPTGAAHVLRIHLPGSRPGRLIEG